MGLLSGLEQFGFQIDDGKGIFEDEKKKEQDKAARKLDPVPVSTAKATEADQPETDFLFTKRVRCTICDRVFDVRMVKSARIKRLQPDFDLRPRFQYIDTLKYDVYACPYCGYAAMSRYFEHLTRGQINLVQDTICANFKRSGDKEPDTYTYEQAIARYKLALYCSVVKHAKTSEKAYTCLKISWLYRDMIKGMKNETEEEKQKIAEAEKEQEEFYQEAYEGLKKAVSTEDFPICGMDSFTMDYLLAAIACHYKEYSYASKAVSNILTSQIADRRIKDRALELKDEIIAAIKKNV